VYKTFTSECYLKLRSLAYDYQVAIAIFGAGGHAKSVSSTLMDLGIKDFFHVTKDGFGDSIYNKEIVSEEIFLNKRICQDIFIAIGDNKTRKFLYTSLLEKSKIWNFPSIIHKSAVVSSETRIGEGALIGANAYVGPSVFVGKFVIINTGATLEHDSFIDDFASLGPMSVTGGGVKISQGCEVGLGATLHPQVTMDDWSTLGAASYLRNSLQRNATAVGSPARVLYL
jgi:acetyltransferase EpsM